MEKTKDIDLGLSEFILQVLHLRWLWDRPYLQSRDAGQDQRYGFGNCKCGVVAEVKDVKESSREDKQNEKVKWAEDRILRNTNF